MRLSQQLLADLRVHEGFRSRPYLCPTGHVTIGYGHNLEAHPDSISLFPEMGSGLSGNSVNSSIGCSDAATEAAWMEAAWAVDAVKAGTLRGRALLDRLTALGMEWNEEEAADVLERDVLTMEADLAARCPAYRHLSNGSSAESAGRTLSAAAPDPAGVRADVLLNMAFNLGVNGLLQFRRMLEAVRNDDFQAASSEMMNSRWAAQVKGRAVELAARMITGTLAEISTERLAGRLAGRSTASSAANPPVHTSASQSVRSAARSAVRSANYAATSPTVRPMGNQTVNSGSNLVNRPVGSSMNSSGKSPVALAAAGKGAA